MKMRRRNLLVLVSIMMLVAVAAAAVIFHLHFKQRLVLVTGAKIKVYYDKGLTQELKQGDTLDWGTHGTTEDLTKDFWIKNTGSVDVTLNFGWSGEHPWMSMSWNYTEGTVLSTDEVIHVQVVLDLPENIGAGEYWWDGWFEAIPVT